MDYEMFPKIHAAFGVSGGYSAPSQGSASWVHADQARLTYSYSEKLTLNARGGYEWRFQSGNSISGTGRDAQGFIAGIGADYLLAASTAVGVTAERSIRPSIYEANSSGLYNTVAVNLRQNFGERIFATLTGSYSMVEYDITETTANALQSYDFYSTQLQVGYQFTKRLNSNAFYRRLGRSSGAGLGTFTSNEVGMNVSYHF
jgi:hypothetical protein